LKRKSLHRLFGLVVVWCTLLISSGCAPKLPISVPLDSGEQREAAALLAAFVERERPPALDADLRLQWDILGSKGGVGGILQLQQPAFLRFSATDPLGRPFLTVVSNGSTFTMVDNRTGRVYEGKTDSEFWRSHVPEAVLPEDLLPLLGGFLATSIDTAIFQSSGAPDQSGFWYVWQDSQAVTHYVLIDRQESTVRRHLLVESGRDVIVDVTYSEYRGIGGEGFAWPWEVRITGRSVTGTLTLRTETIYSHNQLPHTAFDLAPPPHFLIEQVQ
jgi:hypothetical protein